MEFHGISLFYLVVSWVFHSFSWLSPAFWSSGPWNSGFGPTTGAGAGQKSTFGPRGGRSWAVGSSPARHPVRQEPLQSHRNCNSTG